jgi:hypothetical protein
MTADRDTTLTDDTLAHLAADVEENGPHIVALWPWDVTVALLAEVRALRSERDALAAEIEGLRRMAALVALTLPDVLGFVREGVGTLRAAMPGENISAARLNGAANTLEGQIKRLRALAPGSAPVAPARDAERSGRLAAEERADALAEHVSDLVRYIGRVDQVSPADDLRSDECLDEWDDLRATVEEARLALAPVAPEGRETEALEKCMAVLRWHLSAYQRKDEPMMLAALEAGETALGRRERLVPPAPETPAPSGEPRDANRPYTAEEFLDLPVALREQVPTKLRPEVFGGPAAAPAKEDDRG